MNQDLADIVSDLNSARPATAGGTGGSSVITGFDGLATAGNSVASGATLNLDAATGPLVDITGTTTITAVTLAAGKLRMARAAGAFTLTASATLLVNRSATVPYTTVAGDLLFFRGYTGGEVDVWVVAGSADLGTLIHGLTADTTPVDADLMVLASSANSFLGRQVTWLQAWADYFKGKADALYQPIATILSALGALANGAGYLLNNGSGSLSWGTPTAGQPIPSSSTFAVGSTIWMHYSSASALANGSTTAGSNIAPAISATNGTLANSSATQSGTWRNDSGATMQNTGTNNVYGQFTRTA